MTALRHGLRHVLRFAIPLVVTACGGESGDPTAPPEVETLSNIQSQVFDPFCAGHHGPSEMAAGLDLSAGRSFEDLVNVLSTQVGLNRVTPGDSEMSYLVHKIEGRTGIAGQRMPPAGAPLTQGQIAAIRRWIDAGARNN